MTQIKEYKQLTKIILREWDPIITSIPIETILAGINESKFVKINWCIENSTNFLRILPFKADSVESYITGLDHDTQTKVRLREKQKIDRLGKWFDSIQEVEKRISTHLSPNI